MKNAEGRHFPYVTFLAFLAFFEGRHLPKGATQITTWRPSNYYLFINRLVVCVY